MNYHLYIYPFMDLWTVNIEIYTSNLQSVILALYYSSWSISERRGDSYTEVLSKVNLLHGTLFMLNNNYCLKFHFRQDCLRSFLIFIPGFCRNIIASKLTLEYNQIILFPCKCKTLMCKLYFSANLFYF